MNLEEVLWETKGDSTVGTAHLTGIAAVLYVRSQVRHNKRAVQKKWPRPAGPEIDMPSQQILRKPVTLSTSGGVDICPNSIRP